MSKSLQLFNKDFLAGILISLGGYANLTVGGIAGAVLFSFGLLSVIFLGCSLFTGMVGNMKGLAKSIIKEEPNEAGRVGLVIVILMLLILLGNVTGCLIFSLFTDIADKAAAVVTEHASRSAGRIICDAIICGLVVDLCVCIARERKSIIPVLIGVPLFIMVGGLHCIAEAYYILEAKHITFSTIGYWLLVVLGNTIGCNVRAFFALK